MNGANLFCECTETSETNGKQCSTHGFDWFDSQDRAIGKVDHRVSLGDQTTVILAPLDGWGRTADCGTDERGNATRDDILVFGRSDDTWRVA